MFTLSSKKIVAALTSATLPVELMADIVARKNDVATRDTAWKVLLNLTDTGSARLSFKTFGKLAGYKRGINTKLTIAKIADLKIESVLGQIQRDGDKARALIVADVDITESARAEKLTKHDTKIVEAIAWANWFDGNRADFAILVTYIGACCNIRSSAKIGKGKNADHNSIRTCDDALAELLGGAIRNADHDKAIDKGVSSCL